MPQETIIQLLLGLLRSDKNRVRKDDLHQLSPADWQALYDLATRQQIVALLYHRLKVQNLLDAAPADIQQSLADMYRLNAVRNMKIYHEFRQIAAAFQAASIPAIVLKGAYLAKAVYQNIALRQMGDMDLLVPKPRLAEAVDILHRQGYKETTPFTIEVDTAVAQHLTRFVKPPVGAVELHWTLTRPGKHYTIDVDELWERAIPANLAGIEVLSLSPEDLLLHLCLHTSYQHQFAFGLRPSCDIARMIQHYQGELDWGAVQQRAEAWGWGRGVYLALRVARELVGAAVPGKVLRQLKPSAFEEAIVATAKDQIFAYRTATGFVSRNLAQLMGRDNLWASLRDFARSIFVPRVVLAKNYPISPKSRFIYFYYLVRFKDVLTRHGRTAWRLYRHDPEIASLADRTRDLSEWLSDE
jgi:hypothetical protein